jgi:hypothetical protein
MDSLLINNDDFAPPGDVGFERHNSVSQLVVTRAALASSPRAPCVRRTLQCGFGGLVGAVANTRRVYLLQAAHCLEGPAGELARIMMTGAGAAAAGQGLTSPSPAARVAGLNGGKR